MKFSTIINELLEAIVLQELAMANLIDAEAELIQACSIYNSFREYQIGLKLQLDQDINTIFQAFSDHEKWNFKKIMLLNELRQSNLLTEDIIKEETKTEQIANDDINDVEEIELDDLDFENIIDNLDDSLELIDEEDDNDKPSK